MKTRILKIIILLTITGGLIYFNGGLNVFKHIDTVRAFGNLVVDFHVPVNDPIFTISNGKPGDVYGPKPIDVTNNGTTPVSVAVKGVRTGGIGTSPLLESVLEIVINNGTNDIYGGSNGTKTLGQFFTDSSTTNGIPLGVFAPTDHETFTITVTFPTSANNIFQAKSVIFDLSFGNITSDHLVINEVYYQVDSKHGLDSPKDRGIISVNGTKVVISGNGAGSNNSVTLTQSQVCKILQTSQTSSVTNINLNGSTGGNQISGSTGVANAILSGSVSSVVNVTINGGSNNSSGCGQILGQDDEWVELFNPTDHAISLKNYSLTDNSGKVTKINANKTIPAGGFALLSKSASTWTSWTVPGNILKVELGSLIGDGLDNSGDHLILKNPANTEIDRMSWGSDTSGFIPPAVNGLVPLGDSTGRIVKGFDTDLVSDWQDNNPPTPGI